MEEYVFDGGVEGGGIDLKRRTNDDGTTTFVQKIVSMTIDENDEEDWIHHDAEYATFEAFWDEKKMNELWKILHPIFVHPDFRDFVQKHTIDLVKTPPEDDHMEMRYSDWVHYFEENAPPRHRKDRFRDEKLNL